MTGIFVHFSLMTGQQSGWRGNKVGKFSTLLGLLLLRQAVIYLQSQNVSPFLFNVTVQYTELFQQFVRLRLLVTFRFLYASADKATLRATGL